MRVSVNFNSILKNGWSRQRIECVIFKEMRQTEETLYLPDQERSLTWEGAVQEGKGG